MCDAEIDVKTYLEDFEFEPCEEINVGEASTGIRALYTGPVQTAPGCSTAIANGLSQQLIHQMNIVLPNALVSFDELNVELGEAAFPYLQPPAKDALRKAIEERGMRMSVNSAYRTIVQQLLLRKWGRPCGYGIVAPPGKSNHQSGLALDINDHRGWEPYLEKYGWRWFGPKDEPHFDYVGKGTKDIRGTAMLAFQKLWNKNNPNDKIGEDSEYGSQTESRLNQSSVKGFSKAPWDEIPRVLKLSRPRIEGSDVIKLQEKLKAAGIVVAVDGEFGPGTDKAVKEFQQKNSLNADGIVGAKTRELMA